MSENRPDAQPIDMTEPGETEVDTGFLYLVGAIMLLTIGGTLLLISLAYVKDLDTLKNVPGAIWNFVCGRPTPDGPTLPLLLTMSTLAIVIGGGLLVWNRLRQRFS
jgi:hypothetical protein